MTVDRWDLPWKKDRIEQLLERVNEIESELNELREGSQDGARSEERENMAHMCEEAKNAPCAASDESLEALRARMDELQAQRNAMAKRLMDAERDRERYRAALGRAKDFAGEIGRL